MTACFCFKHRKIARISIDSYLSLALLPKETLCIRQNEDIDTTKIWIEKHKKSRKCHQFFEDA